MFGAIWDPAGTLWVAPGLRKDKKLQRVIRGGKDRPSMGWRFVLDLSVETHGESHLLRNGHLKKTTKIETYIIDIVSY